MMNTVSAIIRRRGRGQVLPHIDTQLYSNFSQFQIAKFESVVAFHVVPRTFLSLTFFYLNLCFSHRGMGANYARMLWPVLICCGCRGHSTS